MFQRRSWRCPNAAGALRSVIDDAGIQRDELIVAAAVEREFFDLAFADKAEMSSS